MNPRLVGFWDGSTQTFSGAVHIVMIKLSLLSKTKIKDTDLPIGDKGNEIYDLETHKFVSYLLTAKARHTQLKLGQFVPGSEVLWNNWKGFLSRRNYLNLISLGKNATSLNPFMYARLNEVTNLRAKVNVKTLSRMCFIYPVQTILPTSAQ